MRKKTRTHGRHDSKKKESKIIFDDDKKTSLNDNEDEFKRKIKESLNKEDIAMIKEENEKNEKLRYLGEKYNEVNLVYNQILANIKSMQDYDLEHPLDNLDEEDKEKEGKKEEKEESEENKKVELNEGEERIIEGYKVFGFNSCF